MYNVYLCLHVLNYLHVCFCSIATDDQYATNVPNNIRPDVAMTTMDSDHLPSSPSHQSSAVTIVTRAQGQTDDPSNQREEKGMCTSNFLTALTYKNPNISLYKNLFPVSRTSYFVHCSAIVLYLHIHHCQGFSYTKKEAGRGGAF